jgi:hypothetical protein
MALQIDENLVRSIVSEVVRNIRAGTGAATPAAVATGGAPAVLTAPAGPRHGIIQHVPAAAAAAQKGFEHLRA